MRLRLLLGCLVAALLVGAVGVAAAREDAETKV